MTSKKKSIPADSEPASLRRSSRSTRGSLKPVVDLKTEKELDAELDEDVVIDEAEEKEEEEDDDEDFTETKKKRAPARKGASRRESVKKEVVKRETVKKEPAKRGAGRKSATKPAPQDVKEPVKREPTEEEPSGVDDDDLAAPGGDGETYYELSEAELKDINHAFDMSRISDEEELLNADGLRTAMRSLGFEPRGDEIKKLLKAFAKKANKLNRDGFHKIMALKYGSSPGTKLNNLNDEISRVFNLLDLDKTGLITVDNLKAISKELNEDITEEELYEMIAEADLDGDSAINKQEFQNIMVKTSLY